MCNIRVQAICYDRRRLSDSVSDFSQLKVWKLGNNCIRHFICHTITHPYCNVPPPMMCRTAREVAVRRMTEVTVGKGILEQNQINPVFLFNVDDSSKVTPIITMGLSQYMEPELVCFSTSFGWSLAVPIWLPLTCKEMPSDKTSC